MSCLVLCAVRGTQLSLQSDMGPRGTFSSSTPSLLLSFLTEWIMLSSPCTCSNQILSANRLKFIEFLQGVRKQQHIIGMRLLAVEALKRISNITSSNKRTASFWHFWRPQVVAWSPAFAHPEVSGSSMLSEAIYIASWLCAQNLEAPSDLHPDVK